MKSLLLACVALATLLTISGCTVVEHRRQPSVQSTTTTTEETSSYRQPFGGATTETRTTRY